MKEGNERKAPSLECDVGLGLKMQAAESSSREMAMALPFSHYQYHFDSSGSKDVNQVTSPLGGSGSGGGHFLFHASVGEASPFTAAQWQELERQKMIHKYMMASIPVPPQLILPLNSLAPPVPQSNTGLDSKFSSSRLDPEPWRCKRTDGKKWRCSRDVAPDQKYCERHAHKNRPRSRKPAAEAASASASSSFHNTATSAFSQHHPPILPASAQTVQSSNAQFLQTHTASHFPPSVAASPTSHDQTRCIEWLMRGGSSAIPVASSTCSKQQPWQHQEIPTSSRLELMNRDSTSNAIPLFQPQLEQPQDTFLSLKRFTSVVDQPFFDPALHSKVSPNSTGLTQTTRHFIDAWEKDASKASLSKKLISPSSLTLSMSGMDELGDESNRFPMNSWMNSAPGGPLGEALCLGNATSSRGNSNSNMASVSVHGYCSSNTNTTNTNSSKSSCEDDSHALNFIG